MITVLNLSVCLGFSSSDLVEVKEGKSIFMQKHKFCHTFKWFHVTNVKSDSIVPSIDAKLG